MIRALVVKAFRDGMWLLLAMVILWSAFPWLYIWATSKISLPAFSQFLSNALPKQWERMSGMSFSQLATTAGRVAAIFAHPLVVFGAPVWAFTRGSDCVSGEIGRGTMEMMLAQPVRRTTIFFTQAVVTIAGCVLLTIAVWCSIAVGLATVTLPDAISAALFIPPAVNLFALLFALGGMAALASSWDSQRWRTIGILGVWYAISMLMTIVSRISENWQWLENLSYFHAYNPQSMVARPEAAWSMWEYKEGAFVGLGFGGHQLVLLGIGVVCYALGAVIFNRREIPAPL